MCSFQQFNIGNGCGITNAREQLQLQTSVYLLILLQCCAMQYDKKIWKATFILPLLTVLENAAEEMRGFSMAILMTN